MCAAVFHQWLHEYCPLKSQLSWLVGVTLIFDGTPQIIVQRCQIIAPSWPIDISSAADNAIFKNRAQNIECSFSCVARSTVLLKPNVVNIFLFNFCELKFVQHGPITIAIDCNGLSLLSFEDKLPNYASGPKSAPNSGSFWMRRLFNVCVLVFCAPNAIVFLVHSRQDQNELYLKRWFFSVSRSQAHFPALFKRIHIRIRSSDLSYQTWAKCNVTIHEISTSWRKNVRWRTLYYIDMAFIV